MKLNFTREEKDKILKIIGDYDSVSKEMDDLQKQSESIKKKCDDCGAKLEDLQKKEKELLEVLSVKYGKFSLQDISDTIYGK